MIFITQLFTNPIYFLLVALAVIPSICLHEYFHAQVAVWNGDPTPAETGHLTLNPMRQMGWMSILMFCMFGFAWGAVPVNPYNLSRKGRLLTALAGPCVNLCLFSVSWVAIFLLVFSGVFGNLTFMFRNYIFVLGVFNLVLFVFNMLPIPGLDGWNVLNTLVRVPVMHSEFVKGAMLLLVLCVFLFFDYLYKFGTIVVSSSAVLADMLRGM